MRSNQLSYRANSPRLSPRGGKYRKGIAPVNPWIGLIRLRG